MTTTLRTAWIVLAVAGASGGFAGGAQCPRYEITAILTGPSCGSSDATVKGRAINDLGHVVGDLSCPFGQPRAFVWWGGGPLELLPMPAGTFSSSAYRISNDRVILGGIILPDSGIANQGFLYEDGELTLLGTLPGGNSSYVSARNSAGVVVGAWGNSVGGQPWQAFRWAEPGPMESLETLIDAHMSWAMDINDLGQIVGWQRVEPGDDRTPILLDGDAVTALPVLDGTIWARARTLNNVGDIVGDDLRTITDGRTEVRAVRWRNGEVEDLGGLPGFPRAAPLDINDAGDVVGVSWLPKTGTLWRGGRVFDLNVLVAGEGMLLGSAESINASGEITGRLVLLPDLGQATYVLSPVPPMSGDTTCDGLVDFVDLLHVLSSWGPCDDCFGDLDSSGVVEHGDLTLVLENWR